MFSIGLKRRGSRRLLALTLSALLAFPLSVGIGGLTGTPASAAESEVQSDPFAADMDAATLSIMRRQEQLQPAVNKLFEDANAAGEEGFAGIAFEGDGLTLYWKGAPSSRMQATIDAVRSNAHLQVKPARFSEKEAQGRVRRDLCPQQGCRRPAVDQRQLRRQWPNRRDNDPGQP